jgi:hypothetical protein
LSRETRATQEQRDKTTRLGIEHAPALELAQMGEKGGETEIWEEAFLERGKRKIDEKKKF